MSSKTSISGHVRVDDLVFSLTRQCNALCDICCNDDHPHKKGVIDILFVDQWVRDFAELIPYCRTAGFTGGEVFLRYPEMLKIHAVLASHGFVTSITTNGFWGRNPDRATRMLRELRDLGLQEVAVSIDPSHAAWIPLAHATRAAMIALECGLVVGVTSHFDAPGATGRDYFDPEWHDRIIWDDNHYTLPVGRAASLPRRTPDLVPTHLFCPEVQLVIQPNGDVDPCCSVCLDDGAFVVGNLYRQTMREVLTAMLGDMYLKLVTHRGLDELQDIVRRYHPGYALPDRRHSVCFVCNALRKAENFWMVRDAMERHSLDVINQACRESTTTTQERENAPSYA